jgi:hypothetical protein
MRAQGLGVVIEVGPESNFSVGDPVSGAWGVLSLHLLFTGRAYSYDRHDGVCCDEGESSSKAHVC